MVTGNVQSFAVLNPSCSLIHMKEFRVWLILQGSNISFLTEGELDFWRWSCSFSWLCKSKWVHTSFRKVNLTFSVEEASDSTVFVLP